MMWGYGGLGFLWMALFWIGTIALIAWAISDRRDSRTQWGSRATRILEERFARGEIGRDEFEAARRDLAT